MNQQAGPEKAQAIIQRLSPDARAVIDGTKRPMMVPASHCSEIYRAIAELNGTEDAARDMLIACGKATAFEASNTFLRLIMKVLTPGLFAKKLPDFWKRECTIGAIQAEVMEDRIRNRYIDIGGFDFLAPVAAGFVAFALESMGKTITETNIQGWSLADPGPESFTFEIVWK